MLSPSLTFGLLVGTLCGAIMHLIFGGGGRRLLLDIAAAWLGFILGQALGDVMAVDLLVVGSTHVLTGVLGALAAAGVMVFLTWQRSPHSIRD